MSFYQFFKSYVDSGLKNEKYFKTVLTLAIFVVMSYLTTNIASKAKRILQHAETYIT